MFAQHQQRKTRNRSQQHTHKKKEGNDFKAIMSRHNMLSDIKIKINQVV